MENNEFGRSMVEMIGVLAIIGMLSIGGIWGFSEAMERYKLNKSTAQISAIIHAVSAHLFDTWVKTADKQVSIIPYFKYKTPAIFDDMPIVKSTSEPYEFLQDAFGNYVGIYINRQSYNNQTKIRIAGDPRLTSYIRFRSPDTGVAYCRNVLSVVQQVYKDNPVNPEKLWIMAISISRKDTFIYGQNLADMSVGQMTNLCYDVITAGDGKFYLTILFNNKRK